MVCLYNIDMQGRPTTFVPFRKISGHKGEADAGKVLVVQRDPFCCRLILEERIGGASRKCICPHHAKRQRGIDITPFCKLGIIADPVSGIDVLAQFVELFLS